MKLEFDQLIQEFNSLPKVIREPTYLELCKYPYSRFEEICSRLLCFYFSPLEAHGLGDLFLRSLTEILKIPDDVVLNHNDIKVVSEENADGKRLDILIYSDKFTIGIENKINAPLYNPLDVYKNRIDKYSTNNKYCIVLSLRRIDNIEEKKWMELNGFVNYTYKQLFNAVSPKIITHEGDTNNKYVLYLKDFIKTLNNMTGQNILNHELSDFFYDNSNKIEELIDLYNQFQNEIISIQKQTISDVKNSIENETSYVWWLWEGWLLGTEVFNNNRVRIGLEAYYDGIKDDALGIFQIQIVTWSLNDWNIYEKYLLQRFPDDKVEKTSHKCSILLDTIGKNDEVQIMSALKKHFSYLMDLSKIEMV